MFYGSEDLSSISRTLPRRTDDVIRIPHVSSIIRCQSQLLIHTVNRKFLCDHILNLETTTTILECHPLCPSSKYIAKHAEQLVLFQYMNTPKRITERIISLYTLHPPKTIQHEPFHNLHIAR